LTNDGDLTYRLTHPGFEHEKEYMVHIDGKLPAMGKNRLENGILLEDGKTWPAKVQEITSNTPFTYSLTIHEGRKRQVRRMFESLGYNVIELKRIRIGGLKLGSLKEGEVRRLTTAEINRLQKR
jgi:23S rRNA pseudouridine2605 synthase